jgi:2-polyprenyl-3-methyl-5-hydroxy-6-metoxy-1,4-benzoquinol methylase
LVALLVSPKEAPRVLFHYKGEKMAVASSNTDLHGYGEAIRKELGSRIPRDRKLRILDVGTGFGINVVFLAAWLAKGSSVWTVDPSEEVLVNVQASLGDEGSSMVRFVVGSADDLGFGEGFFDVVVSVMVLHHIEKLQQSLDEMARVLKPGGKLVLIDYKPEASHELQFRTRHDASDFFAPARVTEGIERLDAMAPSHSHDFGLWYLVESKKKRMAEAVGASPGASHPRGLGKKQGGSRRRGRAGERRTEGSTRPMRAEKSQIGARQNHHRAIRCKR